MSEYRYLFYTLLNAQPTVELPLYGTNFSRLLNKAGDGNYTCHLGDENFSDADIIDGTRAGATQLVVERNKVLVWMGINWVRTWQEQSETFQFYGQTHESFLYSQLIEETLTFTNEDQRNIVIQLVEHMQAKPGADIGIVLPDQFPANDPDAIKRTVTFYDYEGWTYGKAIDYMVNYDEGLDWTIEPSWGPNDSPQLLLRVDNVIGAPEDSDTSPVFDYPGSIKNFWFPENASKGAVTTIGFGKGEGSSIVRSKVTDASLLSLGYPDLQRVYTNKDVSVQETLDSQTKAANDVNKVPIITPTVQMNIVEDVMPGSWSLGDFVRLNIQSRRFPNGLDLATRAIGWTLDPPDRESAEEFSIIIPGQEEVFDA